MDKGYKVAQLSGILLLLVAVIITLCYSCESSADKLLLAVQNNDKSKIKELVDRGVDINGTGADGCTPLMFSASRQDIDMMSYLLSLGADINKRNEKCLDKSAIEATIDCHTLENDASVNALKFLLEKGADVKGQNGFDALSMAIMSAYFKSTELLLKNGAPINIPRQPSLLMSPVYRNSLKMCKLLVEHGVDINLRDQDKCSPAIVASQYGRVEILSYLLSNKAMVTKDDIDTVKRLFREGLRDPKVEQVNYIPEEKQKEIIGMLESSLTKQEK